MLVFYFLFLLIIALSFAVLTLQHILFFIRIFRSDVVTAIVADVKLRRSSFMGNYSYIVNYDFNARKESGEIFGYHTPHVILKNDFIRLLIDRNSGKIVAPYSIKGKIAHFITSLVIYVLLGIATFYGLFNSLGDPNEVLKNLVLFLFLVFGVTKFLIKSSAMLAFQINSQTAIGTIADFKESSDGDNTKTYQPLVEFSDRTNNLITFVSEVHYYDTKKRGSTVNVMYHRTYPQHAEINSFGVKYAEILFWIIMVMVSGGYLLTS